MSELKSSTLADFLYNRKLPQVYRDMDSPLENYPLKRYIKSLIEGGFSDILRKCNDLKVLVDPETCPDEIFPLLYESFGYTFDPSVAIIYHRRVMMNHGELVRRRGTMSYVRFLVRALTGFECELSCNDRTLTVNLLANTLEDTLNMGTSVSIVEKFIGNQLPFFVTPELITSVKVQTVSTKIYRHTVVTQSIAYSLVPNNL